MALGYLKSSKFLSMQFRHALAAILRSVKRMVASSHLRSSSSFNSMFRRISAFLRLSVARKYKLSLFLTHQYIDQLHEKIRSAIFGNVGTIISFRIGAEDAEHLAKEFHPVFDESDFVNLPKYSMYLKLMIDGATSKPFSAITLPPQLQTKSFKEEVVTLSRGKYARKREIVERKIFDRYLHPIEENRKAGLFD